MSDDIPRPGHYWQDRASEHNREIERLRAELAECRAAAPPAPAAVVRVGVWGGSLTTRLVLFASKEAAVEFYVKSDHVYDIFISPDTEIVWHSPDEPTRHQGTLEGKGGIN